MTRRIVPSALTMWLALAVLPGIAAAQQESSVESSVTEDQPPAADHGSMTVERVRDGFAIAPDFKITTFNNTTGYLAGAYGGWVIDNTLLIGAGGYGLTNGSGRSGMGYGGAVIGWMAHTDQAIGFGARALVGFGQATYPGTLTYVPRPPFPIPFDVDSQRSPIATTVPPVSLVQATFHEHFFVTEPQADLLIRISPILRLDAGVGYRLIGADRGVNSQLHGATGSLSLQIGGSTYERAARLR
jgi:hypothetical protein